MSVFSHKPCRLEHCIYQTFLHEPRLYYDRAAKRCGVARNTFTDHWKDGLEEKVFFPPQIRLKMYDDRKEYIYLVQSDSAPEMYEDYKKNPDVVYMIYTLGKFDLLIQTKSPLETIPDKTVFHGSRGDYIYPETPYYDFETALANIERLLKKSNVESKIPIVYPVRPDTKGSNYGKMIFPYVKCNLRVKYTPVVKKIGISFASFYKGIDYLLSVSTVLLPYYPLGLMQYSQHLFVFWSDYEELLCKLFGCFPCHVSLVKVSDALLVYAPSILPIEFPLFRIFHRMLRQGYIDRFWIADPLYHWRPDI